MRLLFFSTFLSLASAAEPELQQLLDDACTDHHLPSIAAVVFRSTGPIEQAVSGVRKIGAPEQATLQDHYHLGSITKSMTASVAAMLVEEKKLRWDSTISQVLGKTVADIHPKFRDVTLRELCEHRGGFAHDVPPALWSQLFQRSVKIDEKTNRLWLITAMLKEAPAQDKGTFVYANSGYICAGLMMEIATGTPWQTLMRDKLFSPLGMKSAGFGPCTLDAAVIDQPWPHVEGKPIAPGLAADNPAALGPAGTVHCSITDLGRYGAWHLAAGSKKPKLTTESFALLHESRYYEKSQGGYALGWQQVPRPWAKGNALTHNGTNTMNYAVIWLAPEKNLGIAVVCNEGKNNVAQALDAITAAMVKKYATAP